MKFLCIACDQRMQFLDRQVPADGTFAAAFRCPTCNWRIAMLANPMETQLVRALGENIGGRPLDAQLEDGRATQLARHGRHQTDRRGVDRIEKGRRHPAVSQSRNQGIDGGDDEERRQEDRRGRYDGSQQTGGAALVLADDDVPDESRRGKNRTRCQLADGNGI